MDYLKKMMKRVLILLLFIPVTTISFSQIIDHNCTTLQNIPATWIDLARADLHIAYEHTSHGSQITVGMTGLYNWKGTSYAWNDGGTGGALDIDDYGITGGSDLGAPDYTSWADATRSYLDDPANSDVNVIMWSWCGELSYADESDVTTYLGLMTGLESDYPNVKFVYMTGHLDGTGLSGNLHLRNEQIRAYCRGNNKILYDFADIETYDPDGVYYGNMRPNDGCNYDYDHDGVTESTGDPSLPTGGDRNWAIDWQNSHTEGIDWYDVNVEHTQPLNGNRKAYAAWWLWACLAGWESTTITTGEISGSEYCAGTGVTEVPFTCFPSSFFASSVFTAQLSDASGSFSSPVELSSSESDGSENQSLTATIPAGTVAGSGYRIRVISDSPAVAGSDNGSDISVRSPGRWTGVTSTDWNTASNWSCGMVPVSGEVVIDNAENEPVITAAVSCGDLTILPGASLWVMPSGSLSITGDLTVSGSLTIESDNSFSGSLIVAGTSTGNVTYNRYMPADNFYHYISSPVNSSLLPTTGTFWAWDEESGGWGDPVTDCENGKGYTLRTNGSTVTFSGSVVTESDIIASSPYYSVYTDGTPEDYAARWASGRTDFGGGGWNLLGNPFTSALKIGGEGGFLDANDGDGTIASNRFDPNYVAVYIYNGDSYFYRGKDVSFPDPVIDEDPANQMFGFDNIQAGQGFFVLAMQDGVTFHFDRSMQTHDNPTTMLKSAKVEEPWPGVQLKVRYGSKERITTIVYNEQMTAGLDPGYDVGLLSAGPDVEIYTTLAKDDDKVSFVRQALPLSDFDKNIIPVGLDSEKGGKVTFSAFVVPPGDYKFWLEDRETGTFTDMNTNTYAVTLAAETFGTGRFFIYASKTTPAGSGLLSQDPTLLNIRVWTSHNKMIIEGALSDRSIASVYDLHGNSILETSLNGGSYNTVNLPPEDRGVYVVKVTDGAKIYVQKIVIL